MADADEDEATSDTPTVDLGAGESVNGAPLARVTARLHFGIERSEVERREGDTTIRTPDGARRLADILAERDETYFPTRQALEGTVRDVVGHGPVRTE